MSMNKKPLDSPKMGVRIQRKTFKIMLSLMTRCLEWQESGARVDGQWVMEALLVFNDARRNQLKDVNV